MSRHKQTVEFNMNVRLSSNDDQRRRSYVSFMNTPLSLYSHTKTKIQSLLLPPEFLWKTRLSLLSETTPWTLLLTANCFQAQVPFTSSSLSSGFRWRYPYVCCHNTRSRIHISPDWKHSTSTRLFLNSNKLNTQTSRASIGGGRGAPPPPHFSAWGDSIGIVPPPHFSAQKARLARL